MLSQLVDWPIIVSLYGYTKDVDEAPSLSVRGVTQRTWQDSTERFINSQMNVRPAYVRFRNFFDYELFDEVHVQRVFKGKENYLFNASEAYMNGYGNVGIAQIEKNVIRLKQIQDSLRKEGKPLLFVIAPEKVFVYPEYLPDRLPLKDTVRFMYDNYCRLFQENSIDVIDFNAWYLQIKDTAHFEIFARGGKHWTDYYASIAFDSIGDRLRGFGVSVPDVIHRKAEQIEKPRGLDVDTWRSANLPFSHETGNFAIPVLTVETGPKSKILMAADSYINVIAWGSQFNSQFHASSEFWYYNKEMIGLDLISKGSPKQSDFNQLNPELDAYVILVSVGNISYFDYKFLEYFD